MGEPGEVSVHAHRERGGLYARASVGQETVAQRFQQRGQGSLKQSGRKGVACGTTLGAWESVLCSYPGGSFFLR